jgi:hypothetical protein
MLILFDNGTPAPFRYWLKGHVVVEAVVDTSTTHLDGRRASVTTPAKYRRVRIGDKDCF